MIEVFGDYELLGSLGSGGMGQVYRARRKGYARTVALKRLPADLSRDPQFRARFAHECEIVSQLEHGHIVPIYEYGEIDGQLFISMRVVEGENLDDMIARAPLTATHAVAILAQIASALDYAHENDVEHRDIKPTNIMIQAATRRDPAFAYLVDFGIARTPNMTALTGHGLIGSTNYLAPERISGEESSARSDVYSLACVLYQSVTGSPPFPLSAPQAVWYAHVHAPRPKASESNPEIPPAFDAVIEQGMAKQPDERFASAGEMMEAARLAAASDRPSDRAAETVPRPTVPLPPSPPSSPARKSRRRWPLVAAASVVAIGVLAIVVLLVGQGGAPQTGGVATDGISGPTTHQTLESLSNRTQADRSSSSSQPSALAPGTCLDVKSGAVSCDTTHALEVITPGSACTATMLLSYIGGQAGTDILLPSVAPESVDVGGAMACAVRGPAGDSETGTAKDVLQQAAGDAWRRCIEADRSPPVPCDRPHFGEYVYAGAAQPDKSIDCAQEASNYIGAAFVDLESDLDVERAANQTSVACIVTVRGDNVLTSSIRSLGTATIPMMPK